VACGRETPLSGDREFPTAWRNDADSVYGVSLPQVEITSDVSASALITQIIETSPDPITIFAVGPLTNIAEALQASPQITSNIDALFVMGGAVHVDGKVGGSGVGSDNNLAEWNIYIDPHAANIVFGADVPVTIVPLDATNNVPVTMGFVNRLEQEGESPVAQFIAELLRANEGIIEFGGIQFWDTLTAAILSDDRLAAFETLPIFVTEDGHTKLDENGALVRIAISADRRPFEDLLLAVINQ
jgi:inosine-uridine nucleoside N-ribohydrolase